ncbi:MAG: diguanylate cyclase [Longimicrobiales bacterium]|nr:diguanylate cyclase [Longimicrobiales bacterium]
MLTSEKPQADGYARSHPALVDAQTGLANRLHFDLVYDYMFEAGDRGLPFTVMLLSAGADEKTPTDVIRALGQAIEKTTRNSDLVSHVGGGRYVVLLLGTNLPGGRIAADRVEMALNGLAPGAACFGLATFSEKYENSQELLRAADTALLAAEAAGGGVEFGS